jgi:hypothetical protein
MRTGTFDSRYRGGSTGWAIIRPPATNVLGYLYS